ncbi:N-acetylmuramoyl-L-alanine amidase family protein [Paenibacillus validus]|uniref:AMIN domain-containing protein n=1 Tax=Paenibacillus validus TaxID=44253 RepID=A0A7X3CTI2_9BACL|nr:N-acetylmuramoyl-L-alanine amidase family protein [Paenibacillus validus]MUG71771.1 AMIN domain-containing protein [Paenibacillus validus]
MKFLTSWFMLLLLSLLLIPAVFAESPSIQLFMNGKQLVPEVSPRIVNGNTIVPVRIIAESLGSKVSWDAKQRKVSVDQGQTSIQLFIDKTSAVVNGKTHQLEAPPVIIGGNTMLPLRFVVEQLNTKVTWDELTRSVFMYKQEDSGAKPVEAGQPDVNAGGVASKPGSPNSGQPPAAKDDPKPNGGGSGSQQELPASGGAGKEQSAVLPVPDGQPVKAGELPVGAGNAATLPNAVYAIALNNDELVVHTSSESVLNPKIFRLSNPDRLVIDVPGVELDTALTAVMNGQSEGILALANDKVSKIRYSLFSKEDSIVRIVVDLAKKVPFSYTPSDKPGQFSIQFPERRSKFLVYVDPGHGDGDPGTSSKATGRQEKTFVLAVGKKVAALLEKEPNIQVAMTRSDDTFVKLQDRVAMANNADADLFVSIHANSGSKESIGGTETFYNTEQSLPFAKIMHQELLNATGFPDRKVKFGDLHVVRETTMPSVLLEIGFMSNKTEEELMFQDAFQNQVAAAIVRGIKKQLHLE